jgi:cyclase
VTGALEACRRLREWGADTVVPGHGEPCDVTVVDAAERYLRFVLDAAAEAAGAGLTPLEAAREVDLGEFTEWHDRERIVGNLHRAMLELAGAERGAPIDVPAAFLDMIVYNGGQPLRCLA